MATSGSKSFALTRNDIINAALRKVGEYDKGETPSGDETADASQALNILINELVGVLGAEIFLRTEMTLFVNKLQTQYGVGPNSGDHITESYVETTIAEDPVDTATTVIVLTSATGISDGDYIGIKMDDGSIFWDTVNGAPAGTTVTITAGFAELASIGNTVYAYTTKAYRPRKIFAPYSRDQNGLDNSITLIGEAEYRQITDKDSTGVPNSLHYRASLDSGALYVWPTGDGNTDKINFIGHYYPDDLNSASDNAEFPIEWSAALIWGLAAELGAEYGLPRLEQEKNWKIASAKVNAALDVDTENASVTFARAE